MSLPITNSLVPSASVLPKELPPAGTRLGKYKVSIAGLDKTDVLMTLYNNAHIPKALESELRRVGEETIKPILSKKNIKSFIGGNANYDIEDDEFDVDYIGKIEIKARTEGHILHTRGYNWSYGENKAEELISELVKYHASSP